MLENQVGERAALEAPGPELFAAIVKAQQAAKEVEKGSRNDYHRYNYASAEDVVRASREALGSAGLALLVTSYRSADNEPVELEDPKTKSAQVVERGTLYCEYLLVHTSGQSLAVHGCTPWHTEKGRPPDKAVACAKTYDLSYTLRSVLLLPRVEESNEPDTRDDTKFEPKRVERRPLNRR